MIHPSLNTSLRRLRNLLLIVSSFALLITLLVGIPLAALSRTVTDQTTAISILGSKQTYEQILKATDNLPLDQLGSDAPSPDKASQDNRVFFDQEIFEPLIAEYFSYEFYAQATGVIVPTVYDWLSRQSEDINFSVPITDDATKFKSTLTDLLVARYNKFPVCPAGSIVELEQLFKEECRVPQITNTQIRTVIYSELGSSNLNSLVNNAAIDSEEFVGEITPADSERAKDVFETAKSLPALILAMIILLVGLVVLGVFDNSRVYRTLGLRLLVPAVLLVIGGLVFRLASSTLIGSAINNAGAGESSAFIDVTQVIAQQYAVSISNLWLIYSVLIAFVGVILMVIQKILKKDTGGRLRAQQTKP